MRHAARALLVPLALLAVAACGDPTREAAGTLPPAATTAPPPPTTSPAPPTTRYELATGPEDVVISAAFDGGFVPAGTIFARTPLALITGDGRALTTGPVPAIYPGPLLPNIQQRSITPAAVQRLVARADELGLLRDVTYSPNEQIADAQSAIVDITVGGRTYHHEAYALGDASGPQDADRRNLDEFIQALVDLPGTVGSGELGPEDAFAPERYLIQAQPVDRATRDDDVEPTVVEWPADAPIRLADAADCAALPAGFAASVFEDATTLTFFTEEGVTYTVAAVQQLPGRAC